MLYIHGAGWVFGNAHTHDRLVRELAVDVNAAVVFPEYDLSPEARYLIAIEQNYAVARWIVSNGASKGLDATRLAVAGDSVGGNMTSALTLVAKERGDVPLRPAPGACDHRRGRRPARRGRGPRQQAAPGRCPGHRHPLSGHHPRLRHAQRPAVHPRRRSRHHPATSVLRRALHAA